MKVLAFVIILLAALSLPLGVRAQQDLPTATPILTLSPTPTATPTFTPAASPTETGSPTPTDDFTLTETATPGATLDSLLTVEPTLTATQTWLPSATPPSVFVFASGSLKPDLVSFASRASLDSGINPLLAEADLLDLTGQVVTTSPLNADGTFTLTVPGGDYILRLRAPGYLSAQKTVTLLAGQPAEIGAALLPAGDINGDNSIDALDLISLGAAYETASPASAALDLNKDGYVDLFDLTLLARNWRKIGPITW